MEWIKKHIILIVLAIISIFLAIWYYNKYMKKPSPPVDNQPPSDDAPPTDIPLSNSLALASSPDAGKKAYSKFGNAAVYNKALQTIKTPAKDALIGTVTGEAYMKENTDDKFYIVDDKYLVSKDLVKIE